MKVLESASLIVNDKGNLEGLSPDEQYFTYCALDCCLTHEIWEVLSPKAPEASFAYAMSRTMQAPAWTLMQRGIKIDMARRGEVLTSLYAQKERCEKIFFRLCTEGLGLSPYFDKKHQKTLAINMASPPQLLELFYKTLGIPEIRKYNKQTKERSPTVDREALERIEKEYPQGKPFAELILATRDFAKKIQVLESGLEAGRMHCSYQVAGPMTGRWSSNESAFGGGSNLQNISDEMRRAFIPDEGKKFCQLDLAQAESRIVAHLCLPFGEAYLRACDSGDLHTTAAQLIWPELFRGSNEPPKSVAKRPFYRHFSYRDMSKRGGHAVNYGAVAQIIAMHLKIPLAVARAFVEKYLGAFPEIPAWHNSVRVALATKRAITTPLGRTCHFPGRSWDNDTIKSAIAYSPQSSIGDLLNLGFLNVWLKYDKIWNPAFPIEILTQVHDSILFQYDEKDEEQLIPLLQEELKVPLEINGKVCTIGVDAQVGWNWGKVLYDATGKVIGNPFGLQDYKGRDSRSAPSPTRLLDRKLSDFHSVFK